MDDIFAYFTNDAAGFNSYVDANYDSSGDYWLLKNDGSIADDNSADLHWEAVNKGTDKDPQYKTIWSAGGMTKEESLIALLGGKEKAQALLEAKGVSIAENSLENTLGALVMANFLNENSVLSLEYAQFDIKGVTLKDWQAIYNSYTANEDFFENYSWISGREDLLTKANLGDTVTTKLEYYSLLFNDLIKKLPLKGTAYENDPLAYLKESTTVFSYPEWGSVRINKAMALNLGFAFDLTKLEGGTIPKNSGGLSIRFMNNDDNELKLSEHAKGMAIDFDSNNNGQYFIGNAVKTNAELNSYLKSLGLSLSQNATGWDANQKLAQAFSGYKSYLLQNELYHSGLVIQSSLSGDDISRDQEKQARELMVYYQKLRQSSNSIPQLAFSMDKIFVENMRKVFNWGGDWPLQKDYMHFEARSK
jgi:hypothetical protein